MFISNNRAVFHLWLKESLVKYQKASTYYAIDCRSYAAWRQKLNICLTVAIQKYWNEIFQEDGYLHSKMHCLTLDLLFPAALEKKYFFRFVFALKSVYFSDLFVFNYAFFCLQIKLNLYRFPSNFDVK